MKILFFIAGLLLFAGGCLQVEYRFETPDNRNLQEAEIIYAGAPEVDGCSWLIRMDDKFYHPEILADNYKVENLPVMIEYIETRETYRCGRGGVSYKTIRILHIENLKMKKEVSILQENQWNGLKMDGYKMDSVYVLGDSIHLKISYSGGCREHLFRLWKLPPNALMPPPVELLLDHDAQGDMCEAWVTKWLVYSLKPIRLNGTHDVPFLMRGSPEMSAYFGKFVYKY
jgi:hypothetical protein